MSRPKLEAGQSSYLPGCGGEMLTLSTVSSPRQWSITASTGISEFWKAKGPIETGLICLPSFCPSILSFLIDIIQCVRPGSIYSSTYVSTASFLDETKESRSTSNGRYIMSSQPQVPFPKWSGM